MFLLHHHLLLYEEHFSPVLRHLLFFSYHLTHVALLDPFFCLMLLRDSLLVPFPLLFIVFVLGLEKSLLLLDDLGLLGGVQEFFQTREVAADHTLG